MRAQRQLLPRECRARLHSLAAQPVPIPKAQRLRSKPSNRFAHTPVTIDTSPTTLPRWVCSPNRRCARHKLSLQHALERENGEAGAGPASFSRVRHSTYQVSAKGMGSNKRVTEVRARVVGEGEQVKCCDRVQQRGGEGASVLRLRHTSIVRGAQEWLIRACSSCVGQAGQSGLPSLWTGPTHRGRVLRGGAMPLQPLIVAA